MSEVSIEIQAGLYSYCPGETLSGSASWKGDEAPQSVEVRLFWFTSGVSLSQAAIVKRIIVDRPAARASPQFQFVLPDGPWSFRGRFVSLNWAVEVVLLPSRGNARQFITVSPDRKQIDLSVPEVAQNPEL
jgi:hypothetical protein